MRKKWWIMTVTIVVGGLTLALTIPAIFSPRPGVTIDNCDRIEPGMSRTEVEVILGQPGTPKGMSSYSWTNDAGDAVSIRFDNDRVVGAAWTVEWPDRRTAIEKLLDRLPWRASRTPCFFRPTSSIDMIPD